MIKKKNYKQSHTTYMNNEDVCKSLVTQNIITQDSHQTPKMHMITKDNNMDEHKNKWANKHNKTCKHT